MIKVGRTSIIARDGSLSVLSSYLPYLPLMCAYAVMPNHYHLLVLIATKFSFVSHFTLNILVMLTRFELVDYLFFSFIEILEYPDITMPKGQNIPAEV